MASEGPTAVVQTLLSEKDDVQTEVFDETGQFEFMSLIAGDYGFNLSVPDGWDFSAAELQRITPRSIDPDGRSGEVSISADGRFVAFISSAKNLVVGDNNDVDDVFVYDRLNDSIERVSISSSGVEADERSFMPFISSNGRYVTFVTDATNLIPGGPGNASKILVHDRDTGSTENLPGTTFSEVNLGRYPVIDANGRYVAFISRFAHVYLYDRDNDTVSLVSKDSNGDFGNDGGEIDRPAISDDGGLIAFASNASNLTPDDNNGARDIFVFNRETDSIERVGVGIDGSEINGSSSRPILSADGRYLSFISSATNLVLGDGNRTDDSFILDRKLGTVERISVDHNGNEYQSQSFSSGVSADGRYVVFWTHSDSVVPGDQNHFRDVFVRDRFLDVVERVSVNRSGIEGNGDSGWFRELSISDDGQFIAFVSDSTNLVPDDGNRTSDIFIARNPLADTGVGKVIEVGSNVEDLQLGLIPKAGLISGKLFNDLVENGSFDVGEDLLAEFVVFLDENQNLSRDVGEVFTKTNANGDYQFVDIPSFREYSIVVELPGGWEQVTPGLDEAFSWDVFLPAGGSITGRDFGFQRISGSGQSVDSSVSGRVYLDNDNDGEFSAGDVALADTVVFADVGNDGIDDNNAPNTVTDSQGIYLISNLPESRVAVSTALDEKIIHATPLGSDFKLATFELFDGPSPFAKPQAIAVADFNYDSLADVAVVLGESNQLSIRLNDGMGGFLPEKMDIDLGPDSGGPVSLAVGQFNGNELLDIAIVSNFTSRVSVLYDFDEESGDFQSATSIIVGLEPLDIVAAPITRDRNHLDLVVVNKADNTIQVLLNDGTGAFQSRPAIASGGVHPVSIVAADFTNDENLDLAVAHATASLPGTPSGDVSVLIGDGSGEFVLGERYEVGATPSDMVAANFDNDPNGFMDLAIANFASNTISILTGNGDGTLDVQPQTLGTARGALDIASGDIDNDGDIDVVASNIVDTNVAIFRNKTTSPGSTDFEPLEAVGLGQFSLSRRSPLALADFDQIHSERRGDGTIDIITVPDVNPLTVRMLTNTLVDGSHRVALTGLNHVAGLDFIVKPATLPPSLDPISNHPPIVEDSLQQEIALSGISKGRDSGPPLQFIVESSNSELISNASVQHSDGSDTATLSFTPNPDANGVVVLTISVVDAGADGVFGDTNDPDSDDAILIRSVTVTVKPVNDAPRFEVPATLTVLEDAGLQTVSSFATNISSGGGDDESNQTLSDFVLSTDDSFFNSLPAIDSAGQLTFTPAADVAGTVTVNVLLTDNGGTNDGGTDRILDKFVVNILPVNDAPSFVLGGDITVQADAGPQTRNAFANGFVPGGGSDESAQIVSDYVVTTESPGLFSMLPDISIDGTLSFTPATNRDGSTLVSVQVRDSGGSDNVGNDMSTVKSFSITIESALDSIVLEGAGETVEMSALDDLLLSSVHTIDIRGSGDNRLILDSAKIAAQSPDQTLFVISDNDDEVLFDTGWDFLEIRVIDGVLHRVFVNSAASAQLVGPSDWTNPMIAADVNGNGEGTAGDALSVINAIAKGEFVDDQQTLVDARTVEPSQFRFYDVNGDGKLTALDALFVINQLTRRQVEGEFIAAPLGRSHLTAQTSSKENDEFETVSTISRNASFKTDSVVANADSVRFNVDIQNEGPGSRAYQLGNSLDSTLVDVALESMEDTFIVRK